MHKWNFCLFSSFIIYNSFILYLWCSSRTGFVIHNHYRCNSKLDSS